MLKFIRGKGQHVNAERAKLQKELFAFNKTVPYGFPHDPSALAHDSKLGLLAIGTRHGLLKVYGAPGVVFEGQFKNEIEIRQVGFIPNRAQIVCLCSDSSLHLWEINTKDQNSENSVLEQVKSCDYFSNESSKEGSLKQITTFSINSRNDALLIGTQSGNTYIVDLDKFDLTDQVIYQDVVLQNVSDEFKVNPGPVEVVLEQPLNPDKFLIGYNRGLLVLWDNKALSAQHYYLANQQLESVSWLYNGEQFISSHNDGSYIVWRVTDNLRPSEPSKTPYGPFPCKSINKIIWKTVQNKDDFIIFSGGMPRASYNDKNTVSIIQGTPESGKHHVLDLTSKVIDFSVVNLRDNETDSDNPIALVVLAKEEIVVIDLQHPDWLQFRLPYLSSVHSSAITCCQHYSDVPSELYKQIIECGNVQVSGKFTKSSWVFQGGHIGDKDYKVTNDLLITGHEDGSVRFWNASDVSLHHLYTLHTSKLFMSIDDDIVPIDGDETNLDGINSDDEWPPFRKVGTFDPYSDDPRFAIRKIALCIFTGTLLVAGTAGQVILFDIKDEVIEKPLNSVLLNIVVDKEGFVWKGHDKLNIKNGNVKFDVGYQAQTILQLLPPAAITAMTLHSEWGFVAAGTAHGFGLFDYIQQKVVLSKCTLNPSDLVSTSGGDALISRRKSFKKSLRESFRRLRKGRSQRSPKKTTDQSSSSNTPSTASPSKSTEEGRKSPIKGDTGDGIESKPVERQIEARSSEDSMGSMVRTLYLAPAFISNNTTQSPSLWAGTNSGYVVIYVITLPLDEKRDCEPVTAQLAKEVQLRHRAPVIGIQIIDSNGYPLPDSYEIKKGRSKIPTAQGHRVLICSEEQFKLFNLPNLKPLNKFKLTAHEGSRARRIAIAQFTSKDQKHSEYCIICLSNQGDINILTVPELKRQLQTQCTKREDISGISSLVFTTLAEGFYLQSTSEFRRFSLAASHIVNANCKIILPDGARPTNTSENQPPPIAAAAAAAVVEQPTTNTNHDENPQDNQIKNQQEEEDNQFEPIIEQDTPTSGIEESPINDAKEPVVEEEGEEEEETNLINEITTEINKINVNGTDEYENGHRSISPNKETNDTLNTTNETSDMDNMEITVDSVKDHLNNLSLNDSSTNQSEIKKISPVKNNDNVPIINSHED